MEFISISKKHKKILIFYFILLINLLKKLFFIKLKYNQRINNFLNKILLLNLKKVKFFIQICFILTTTTTIVLGSTLTLKKLTKKNLKNISSNHLVHSITLKNQHLKNTSQIELTGDLQFVPLTRE